MAKTFQVNTASGGSLTTGLVAYYKMEDATEYYTGGGTLDLTNNNTVTFTTGKVNNGGDFELGSSQSLHIDNNLGITGGNISISCWFKLESLPSSSARYLIAYQSDTSNTEYYFLEYFDDSGTKKVRAQRQKHGVGGQNCTYTVDLSTDTWYNFTLWYDGTNIKIFEGATERATAAASGDGSASLANKFAIGAQWGGGTASDFFDGMIDEVGVWSKALSSDELTDLNNGGAGQTMTEPTAINGQMFNVF